MKYPFLMLFVAVLLLTFFVAMLARVMLFELGIMLQRVKQRRVSEELPAGYERRRYGHL